MIKRISFVRNQDRDQIIIMFTLSLVYNRRIFFLVLSGVINHLVKLYNLCLFSRKQVYTSWLLDITRTPSRCVQPFRSSTYVCIMIILL